MNSSQGFSCTCLRLSEILLSLGFIPRTATSISLPTETTSLGVAEILNPREFAYVHKPSIPGSSSTNTPNSAAKTTLPLTLPPTSYLCCMVSHGSSVVCFTPRVIFPFSISSLRILTCDVLAFLKNVSRVPHPPPGELPYRNKALYAPYIHESAGVNYLHHVSGNIWPSEMFASVSFFFSSLSSSRIALLDTTMPLSLFWIMRVSIVWPTISSKSATGRRATWEPGRKTLKGLLCPISQLKPPLTLFRILVATGFFVLELLLDRLSFPDLVCFLFGGPDCVRVRSFDQHLYLRAHRDFIFAVFV